MKRAHVGVLPILALSLVACGGAEPVPADPSDPGGKGATPVVGAPAGTSAPASPAASASSAQAKKLDADTPTRTSSGATFTAPGGWFITARNDILVLEDPDRELAVTLVEVKADESAASGAIAAAWKRVRPDFSRTIKQTVNPPARDGWDAVSQSEYETTTEEARVVIALARRKGDLFYVALIDGKKAAFDRRAAQAMTAVMSFKAAGAEEESFRGKKAHAIEGERAAAFEAFVEEARQKAKVPGAAVAIVAGGKVVFEKGFGVRELGKKDAVTPNTLFMIGSTTKSLTTLLMAILVDERKFTWDTPVTELFPSFALGDAEATKKLTMKHTVCACTGLPRQDMEFIFEYAGTTPEQRVASMKAMKPTTGFGETFQYSNPMVSTGGYIAAHTVDPKKPLGAAYDAAMKAKVFGPLGMTATTLDFAAAKRAEHATPHSETLKLDVVPISIANEEAVISVRPAGAVWSNVRDMARYVMMELAKGKGPDGKSIVSEANLLKRREPQVKVTDKMSYGLGLFVQEDHGALVVHHGGNNLGFTSDMFMLPEHGVGVVVLTNGAGANAFRGAVRRKTLEILFDGRDEARQNLAFGMDRKQEVTAKEVAKITFEPEKAWLDKLVNTYTNPDLGKITVRMDGKRGVLDAGEWKGTIGRMKEDDGTLKAVLLDPPLMGLEFIPVEKDGKTTLVLDMPQQKYVFEPAAAAAPKKK